MTDEEILRGIMANFPDAITVSNGDFVYEAGKPISPERLLQLGRYFCVVLDSARKNGGSWNERYNRRVTGQAEVT